MVRLRRCGRIMLVLMAAPIAAATAQQVTVGTPLVGYSDRFYESFNIGWGFERWGPGGGMFFNFGGPGAAIPPFGGFNPNTGAQFGVAQRWGNGQLNFGLSAATGRSTTLTSSAPSLTVMNGVPGFFQDVTMRPFVVGLVPVVGGYFPLVAYPPGYLSGGAFPAVNYPPPWVTGGGGLVSPLAEKLARLPAEPLRNAADAAGELPPDGDAGESGATVVSGSGGKSTAERSDVSVAAIRRQRADAQQAEQRELEQLIAEAKAAERAGQVAIARVRYRQAAARTTGQQQQELLQAASRQKSP